MTDRLSNGFLCLPIGVGTAVLTFATEGEEMVLGLSAPGLGRCEARLDIELGREFRDHLAETYANALVARTTRAQAEKDDERDRRAAALSELAALDGETL